MSDLTHLLGRAASIPAAAALGALAGLRRARAFHPKGLALVGTWTASDDLLAPLEPDRPWPVVVRLSKGVGLPGSVPDVLGLAVRLPDVAEAGAHQDLLLASSGWGPLGWSILRPTNDFGRATWSSITPYETPIGRGVLWARSELDVDTSARTLDDAAERAIAGDLRFLVGTATEGRDRLLGELRLEERLDPEAAESLAFDPMNTALGLRPVGAVQELRERAYRASQRLRPTPEPSDEATEEAVAEAAGASPPSP